MLFFPLCPIDSWLLPSCYDLDVDQEPAGPKVYPMSMSLTTESASDAPPVTEGFIYHYFPKYNFLCITCPCLVGCFLRILKVKKSV